MAVRERTTEQVQQHLGDFVHEQVGQAQRDFDLREDHIKKTELYHVIKESGEKNAAAFAATLFWQAFLKTEQFFRSMTRVGVGAFAVDHAEKFVVPHGGPDDPRFDLAVVFQGRGSEKPFVADIEASSVRRFSEFIFRNLSGGLVHHEYREKLQSVFKEPAELDREIANYAAHAKPVVVPMVQPPMMMTAAVPTVPFGVASPPGTAELSTAGIYATNNDGIRGVTIAAHAIAPPNSTATVNQLVAVSGITGTVVSVDMISDSAFVELDAMPGNVGSSINYLSGISPREHQPATFHGITSAAEKMTAITGWSPDIPLLMAGSQLKVTTLPDTSVGDSGAALIDDSGFLVGFAFNRTGFKARKEFSTWIWAESVIVQHDLT